MSIDKETVESRVNELVGDMSEHIRIKAMQLYASGGIDTEGNYQGYILPKILVTAAARDCADDYRPFNTEHKEALKNLEHF